MFITITYIKLRSPTQYVALMRSSMTIAAQLKSTSNMAYKFSGFWTTHYTMTSWNSITDMKAFARSGAHLEAMKRSASVSKEIRTLTIEAASLPAWKEAKEMLFKEGKLLTYK